MNALYGIIAKKDYERVRVTKTGWTLLLGVVWFVIGAVSIIAYSIPDMIVSVWDAIVFLQSLGSREFMAICFVLPGLLLSVSVTLVFFFDLGYGLTEVYDPEPELRLKCKGCGHCHVERSVICASCGHDMRDDWS